MRAVASDSELAKLSGIKSDRIILIAFAIGSALAGIAGILVALDVDMTPTMGMNMLLMGVSCNDNRRCRQHTGNYSWFASS